MKLNHPFGPFTVPIRSLQLYKPEFVKQLIQEVTAIDGWLCNLQIPIMWDLASRIRGKMVEVGAWKGRTTVTLLSGADPERFSLDVVDTFLGSSEHAEVLKGGSTRAEFDFNINKWGYQDRVNVLQMTSFEASKKYFDGSLDALFIDAAHDYDSVKTDILAWTPKLKKDGLILFHDYPNPDDPNGGFEELARVLNEYVRDDTNTFYGWGYVAGLAGAYKK